MAKYWDGDFSSIGSSLNLYSVSLSLSMRFLFLIINYYLQQLVVKAVSLAIARDGASGGVVRTVTVR